MIVNGRFRHSEPGGFRRYASEVCERLPHATVVVPPARLARGAAGKMWEQSALAIRARNEVLWSPATSGPIRHRNHVVTLHDLAVFVDPDSVSSRFGAINRRLIPALARTAATIVVDSRSVGDEITARFGVSPEKVTVAPPGVGSIFREVATLDRIEARRSLGLGRYGIDLGAPLIGGLVSTIPRKNASGVIGTLDAMVAAGAASGVVTGFDGPLRVFGRGSRTSSQLVADLGSINDEDLALFYRCLDVFVWLPKFEGFGLPVVEAAAAGTPVVCTSVPAAEEQLSPDVVIVSGKSEAIVAVRTLLDDPSRREQIGHGGLARIEQLTWEATAAHVMRAVRSVEELAL